MFAGHTSVFNQQKSDWFSTYGWPPPDDDPAHADTAISPYTQREREWERTHTHTHTHTHTQRERQTDHTHKIPCAAAPVCVTHVQAFSGHQRSAQLTDLQHRRQRVRHARVCVRACVRRYKPRPEFCLWSAGSCTPSAHRLCRLQPRRAPQRRQEERRAAPATHTHTHTWAQYDSSASWDSSGGTVSTLLGSGCSGFSLPLAISMALILAAIAAAISTPPRGAPDASADDEPWDTHDSLAITPASRRSHRLFTHLRRTEHCEWPVTVWNVCVCVCVSWSVCESESVCVRCVCVCEVRVWVSERCVSECVCGVLSVCVRCVWCV